MLGVERQETGVVRKIPFFFKSNIMIAHLCKSPHIVKPIYFAI